ncbi:hypothetical protein [Butyrivibrio hungatei]|uniref:Uncharacterized protein n=1 Tax=Butyrivibrio hungatei TaxID=185008 RepID=A0A1D9P5T3_9FIRM|nr:hypothetical protein [Butyrivibrio hungatei]AOZ97930.1 hypothetical protein bhn_II131 [Butyrivibrio hungatei]
MKNITAKKWIVDHYDQYGINLKDKSEMIALLNILQAAGENLDSFHDCVINGLTEFMDYISHHGWESDQDLYETVMSHSEFYTEEEFIEHMLEWTKDLKDDGQDPAEEIYDWTYDEPISDTKIYKTEDGYVRRIWC